MPRNDDVSERQLDGAMAAAFGDDGLLENRSECSDQTDHLANAWGSTSLQSPPIDNPTHIGKYLILDLLGYGGLGCVYSALDEQLDRHVAIKVPHRELLLDPIHQKASLDEARAHAKLDHPNVVPIFDFGSTEEHPCYIVSKYIDGQNLTELSKSRAFSRHESVAIIATVADALHHAHTRGIVHRDVKPSNIMQDASGKIYLVDFGLALREADYGTGRRFLGTPAYVSPEQARGESHRVDGRSDIFSLATVLYELLVGRTPFVAERMSDLLVLIASAEPKPPRQIDDTIPVELERICLKAMAKRLPERYTSALDMANELRDYLADANRGTPPGEDWENSNSSIVEQDRMVVQTKGLRSFDQNDADFFPQLLPGTRDRVGTPESIRFWQQAMENDLSNPFLVGLIYGPSGCGKSSLVKAGLLPRLSEQTVVIYLEASSIGTEERLLTDLRKRFRDLPLHLDLKRTLAELRQGSFLEPGKRILIVIDQFEQWLHARTQDPSAELVLALRQCDGTHIQCLLMVRDDFWMAITGFMQLLDVQLIEGWNSKAVDLLPVNHARDVLTAFGIANGDLPRAVRELSNGQRDFIKAAVDGLSDDGKVISVRLALFADMVKGRPWIPSTLRAIGGTTGVGVAFLEETFNSKTSPPQYRYYQDAARSILSVLLPDAGSNIKGHMRSREELKSIVESARRPTDFDEVIRILDHDLRLITPIEKVEQLTGQSASIADTQDHSVDHSSAFYQLSHDYLVQPLRDWLTRKQRETRRGRAELRLADLAEAWNARPENRHLPTWNEYAAIRCLTRPSDRSRPERNLVRRADRYFGIRGVFAVLLMTVVVVGGLTLREKAIHRNNSQNARALVNSLLKERTDVVPYAIEYVKPLRELAIPLLREKLDDGDTESHAKLIAALALARFDDVRIGFLIDIVRNAADSDGRNILAALRRQQKRSVAESLRAFHESKDSHFRSRLASMLLSLGEPSAAAAMLNRIDGDPEERTRFIASYGDWRSGSDDLAAILDKHDSPTFRSGLCCALAEIRVTDLDHALRERLEPVIENLARNDSDPGVHSAAGLVLRRWGVEVKISADEEKKRRDRQEAKITSVGSVVSDLERLVVRRKSKAWQSNNAWARRRLAVGSDENTPVAASGSRSVSLDEPIVSLAKLERRLATAKAQQHRAENVWYVNSLGMTMIQLKTPVSDTVVLPNPGRVIAIADRAVSVGQFQKFVKDQAIDWEAQRFQPGFSPNYPVGFVDWYLAVRFCNWLSEREGLTPCYQRSEGSATDWICADEDGYRLPRISEFWFVCQASTSTAYCCGDNFEDVKRYASLGHLAPSGDRLPNAWGFFDLHGNASEWSNNGWGSDREFFHGSNSRDRSARPASEREPFSGFRVARTHLRPLLRESKAEQVVRLEDNASVTHQKLVAARVSQLVAARKALAPDLVSYTSIDEKLERPLGSVEWSLTDARFAESRIEEFLKFAQHKTEPGIANRARYAEGRLMQLAGNAKEALPLFHSLTKTDPDRPEPLLRFIQCLQENGSPAALDELNRAVLQFPNDMHLWNLWLHISMNHQGRSVDQLMEFLDTAPAIVKELPACENIRWLLASLRDGRPLRINCGAKKDHVVSGEFWFPDAFFVGGHRDNLPALEISECDDPTVYSTIHSFSPETGGSYRIPLPNGRYRITLLFCEGWQQDLHHRDSDVLIEDQPVLRNFAPVSKGFAVAFGEPFETHVADGLLNIDFIPRRNHADINGIHIERVAP